MALTEALAHLHSHGLVHRDVKPSNVIFVNGRPKLADIGLVTDASDQSSIVGTEGYLPPEGPGTPQADIFALGKVLYEAVTGLDRREFPKLPDDLRNWPDGKQVFEVNEVVLKACATDPSQRYATAEAMFAELAMLRGGKSVRRKRTAQWCWSVGKKASAALGAVAAVAALVFFWPRPEPSPDGPDSPNPEANGYCNSGMEILRGDNYTEFAEAYTNFNKAIALDPHFARPYVGLLEMRVREDVPGIPDSTPKVMRDIAQHLEQLAPHLAATYVAKGVVNYSECNFAEAERCLQAAIRANPNYELGQTYYGWLLLISGQKEEVWRQLEICRRLAPSKAVTAYRSVGNCYYLDRNYTYAIVWYQKAIQRQPYDAPSFEDLERCYQALGDYANGIKYGEQFYILSTGADATEARKGGEILRNALAEGGIPGYWRQQWRWTEAKTNSDFYWKAIIRMQLGDTNGAFDWLEQARLADLHDSNWPELSTLLYDDYWDGLHGDPRFQRLLDKVGLAKVMSAKIKRATPQSD
jgi:tetratricopeptide (TPR) repeat protein